MKKRKAAGTKKTVPPAKPVTVSAIVRSVAAWLRRARLVFAHGTTDPVAEAAFIVGETIGLHPDDVESRATAPVTAVQQKKIARLVERRIRTRKPAAYLLKRIYMLGVPFDIDERAIVPRSFLGEIFTDETFAGEEFSLIPDEGSVRNVLDLCTGSGCLAILAAMRFPAAKIDAVELSKGAFELAKQNVARHRLAKRIRVLNGDLFVPVKGKRYDLIITNPPYVDGSGMKGLPPECRHEPAMAFDGGADGLSIVHRIIGEAPKHLTEDGGLLCEIGRGREVLERAYPDLKFLWLETEDSSGEVFWLDARQLR